MTRSEYRAWVVYAEEITRSFNTPSSVYCGDDFAKILEELYDFFYLKDPRDAATYRMLCRYSDRLSISLRLKKAYLNWKGKGQGKVLMRELVYSENPFLRMIPKEESLVYYPIPIITGDNNE